MVKRGLGLRTTILVNIALVMFITMLLISFVVLTMARKTVYDQKVRTGEMTLADMEKSMALFQNVVILFSASTTIAFVFIGSLLLTRYVVKPLETLVKATEEITAGYVPQSLEPTGRNEIGTLAASLAGMSEKLREYKQSVEHSIQSLKESNRELRQAQEELIRSEKLSSVGRLAAGVAHEIGNPVGIILGYLEILRRALNPQEESADALTRIEREVMRIDHVIRELLSFSRPVPVSLHPIAVNPVVEEAISLISHQKEFRAIAVDKQLERHLPAVMADEGQLKQVMINLFINAMDAMQHGGRLTVATGLAEGGATEPADCPAASPAVRISVGDTGTGIEPASLKNIFDPFFTTKSPGKGNGLGLSVSLRIVESFAGTIAVKSSPGEGSTFTIDLPGVQTH